MLLGGAALIDITPEPGLMMTGFIARTQRATGVHDPLTVRAVVLGNTALVVCDVIGIHEDMSLRIRQRAPLPSDNIVIAAVHNHGAPAAMAGRLSEHASSEFLDLLETACVDAIALALDRARPCCLRAGCGDQPGVASNRRHQGGLIDDSLPVLSIVDENDRTIAIVVSYACHPVVLGADNLLYTADYPYYVRRTLESQYPGSVAIFVTGAAGDANSGHLAKDSISVVANQQRTFTEAQRIGERIAHCALNAELSDAGVGAHSVNSQVSLLFERRESESINTLIDTWQKELPAASNVQRALLECWIHWAENIARLQLEPWPARVTVLEWGDIRFIALPGEIFAATAHSIRALIQQIDESDHPVFIIGYAEGNPGYIPPDEEFAYGGYEIDEAHRFYGMSATFAPGSVGRLLTAVEDCLMRGT